jgi:hypothetical protein
MKMYYKIPILNGVLDIDYEYLEIGCAISENEAYVKIREGAIPRDSWEEISKADFEAVCPPQVEEHLESETVEQKLARIEEQNLIIMDALATTFEEVLILQSIVEGRAV